MNKLTQIIISVAGILVIITCVELLRKPSNPNIEFILEWEKAKQEAVEKANEEPVGGEFVPVSIE